MRLFYYKYTIINKTYINMRINGKITEIITSRALVSFGGFVELEGKNLKI